MGQTDDDIRQVGTQFRKPAPRMNLYLLTARKPVDYDSYDGHVVRAWTEHDARRAVPMGDEGGWPRLTGTGADFWRKDATSACVQIGKANPGEDETACLLSSFNAG